MFRPQYSSFSFCLSSPSRTILQPPLNPHVPWHLISHSLPMHHFNDPYTNGLNSLDSEYSLFLSGNTPTVEQLIVHFQCSFTLIAKCFWRKSQTLGKYKFIGPIWVVPSALPKVLLCFSHYLPFYSSNIWPFCYSLSCSPTS